MQSTIAIVERQFLTALGLKSFLSTMFAHVNVETYSDIGQLKQQIESNDGSRPYFVHFFIEEDLLSQNTDYFRSLPQVTIAISHNSLPKREYGFPVLNVAATENELLSELVNLRENGKNGHSKKVSDIPLSEREKEVLRMVAKGMLNKEISDSLCISLNTVITHRTHITEKLGIRSVPELTMYAVLNGLIDYKEIYKK